MNSSFSLMLFPSWRQPQQNIHLVQVFLEVPHLIQFCSDHDTHLANASGNKILLKGFKIWRTRYFRLSIFILQHASSTLGVMNSTTATQAWNTSTYQPTESSMLLKRSCTLRHCSCKAIWKYPSLILETPDFLIVLNRSQPHGKGKENLRQLWARLQVKQNCLLLSARCLQQKAPACTVCLAGVSNQSNCSQQPSLPPPYSLSLPHTTSEWIQNASDFP